VLRLVPRPHYFADEFLLVFKIIAWQQHDAVLKPNEINVRVHHINA
jgi:hypothetical protein